MERTYAISCNGKYSTLNDFCYAEFKAYYALENKSSKTEKYQAGELDDNLTENNHERCFYPSKLNLNNVLSFAK